MPFPFRIKVCGLTDEHGARAAVEAGADHLGLVLCRSVRRVDAGRAAELVRAVRASWVGVLVDPDPDEAARIAERLRLSALQLHGAESPETVERIRGRAGVPVWKAIDAAAADALDRWAAFASVADAIVLDRPRGGSGRALDWDRIGTRFPTEGRRAPTFLAGGLGPDNVERAIAAVRPDGVDASSRLESAPGRKDAGLVRRYVRRARAAAAALADAPVEEGSR